MKVTSSAYERHELVESAAEIVKNAIDSCRLPCIKYGVIVMKGDTNEK